MNTLYKVATLVFKGSASGLAIFVSQAALFQFQLLSKFLDVSRHSEVQQDNLYRL